MRAVVIGASGGIGSALAEALVATGAEVHALSRQGNAPPGAQAGRLDLADETSIAAAADRIGADGSVDLVVVATGLLHDACVAPEKSYRDLDADRLAVYFAVNSIGPALVAKHFLPLLPRRGRSVFAALSGARWKHQRQSAGRLVRLPRLEGRAQHAGEDAGDRIGADAA